MFLQCPFQYFGNRTLRLITAPPLPQDRLDFLAQGIIVHEVLATWYAEPQDIGRLFESVFERVCEERGIPICYHTERLRNSMLDDLRGFVADPRWPRGEFQSVTEKEFRFALDDSLTISGKIDRIDTALDGRAYVIDYKYSAAQRTKARLTDERLLQAPLYLLGAEKGLGVKAAGMFYVGLKRKVEYAGWSDSGMLDSIPLPEDWLQKTAERTLQAAAEIRAGRVEADPADRDKLPLLRLPRRVPRGIGGRGGGRGSGRGGSGARMSDVQFTSAQQQAIDVSRSGSGRLRGGGSGLREDHGAGGVFPPPGGRRRGPARILAITFTEKAAGNMRKKLAEAFQEQPAIRARLERAWVSTVHGFCGRAAARERRLRGHRPGVLRRR